VQGVCVEQLPQAAALLRSHSFGRCNTRTNCCILIVRHHRTYEKSEREIGSRPGVIDGRFDLRFAWHPLVVFRRLGIGGSLRCAFISSAHQTGQRSRLAALYCCCYFSGVVLVIRSRETAARWACRCLVGGNRRGAARVAIVAEDDMMPNKSPEPTAVGAVRSAVAVRVASRRWLSLFR